MKRSYKILDRKHSRSRKKLAAHLARQGQLLLPQLELVGQSRQAIDELIDVVGRATVEAALEWSAEQVAGPRSQGRPRSGGLGWHG